MFEYFVLRMREKQKQGCLRYEGRYDERTSRIKLPGKSHQYASGYFNKILEQRETLLEKVFLFVILDPRSTIACLRSYLTNGESHI